MLEVCLHGRRVGVLRVKKNGNLQFRYDQEHLERPDAAPLSQILPLQREGFPHRTCVAFFANLLPEEGVRDRVAEILGISAENAYGMLERIGGDCAGAVTLWPEGRPRPAERGGVRQLGAEQLDRLVGGLEERPLAVDEEGEARLSLAGSQPKAPVIYDGSSFSLSVGGEPPTTHILKPEPTRFPGLVDNEFFCMRLAKAVELPVAEVERGETKGGAPFLLVARYDRDLTDEPIRRLHQEDMCQALGKLPHEKYQQEGGPTVREIMDLLNAVSAVPAQDRPALWSALVFNFLIGNCDAHGKNYSLLYDRGAPHLAPLYDLVSTAVYKDFTQRLAMSIDGAHRLSETSRRAWEELASEIRFSSLYANRTVVELAGKVAARARELAADEEHRTEIVSRIVTGIEQRAAALR